VFDGDDGVWQKGLLVFYELSEAASDESLDCAIGGAPAAADRAAAVQGWTPADESVRVFSYQDCIGDASVHRNSRVGRERCGGRFAPGVAGAGGTDKRPRLLLPLPLGGVGRPYGGRFYTVLTENMQDGISVSMWVGRDQAGWRSDGRRKGTS